MGPMGLSDTLQGSQRLMAQTTHMDPGQHDCHDLLMPDLHLDGPAGYSHPVL